MVLAHPAHAWLLRKTDSKTTCSDRYEALTTAKLKYVVHRTLASVMTISITSVTKGSYSTTSKACNLILLTELHFTIFYKVTKSPGKISLRNFGDCL
jgi:hypothetical protein